MGDWDGFSTFSLVLPLSAELEWVQDSRSLLPQVPQVHCVVSQGAHQRPLSKKKKKNQQSVLWWHAHTQKVRKRLLHRHESAAVLPVSHDVYKSRCVGGTKNHFHLSPGGFRLGCWVTVTHTECVSRGKMNWNTNDAHKGCTRLRRNLCHA